MAPRKVDSRCLLCVPSIASRHIITKEGCFDKLKCTNIFVKACEQRTYAVITSEVLCSWLHGTIEPMCGGRSDGARGHDIRRDAGAIIYMRRSSRTWLAVFTLHS